MWKRSSTLYTSWDALYGHRANSEVTCCCNTTLHVSRSSATSTFLAFGVGVGWGDQRRKKKGSCINLLETGSGSEITERISQCSRYKNVHIYIPSFYSHSGYSLLVLIANFTSAATLNVWRVGVWRVGIRQLRWVSGLKVKSIPWIINKYKQTRICHWCKNCNAARCSRFQPFCTSWDGTASSWHGSCERTRRDTPEDHLGHWWCTL